MRQLDTVIYELQRVNNQPGSIDFDVADALLLEWQRKLGPYPELNDRKRDAKLGILQAFAEASKALDLCDSDDLNTRAIARNSLARILSVASTFAPNFCVKRKVQRVPLSFSC